LAKCKLISNLIILSKLFLESNVREVEELLKECEGYLNEFKFNVAELKKEVLEAKRERAENKTVTNDDKSSVMVKSKVGAAARNRQGNSITPTFVDFKWMLSALGTIAAFYNAIGNQNRCEKSYVSYVRYVEQFYGSQSLESSNCYFLVGLYYFEENLL